MAEKFFPYDPAQDLETEDDIALFLSDAFETNNAAYIAEAMGVVARAKGMTQIAKKTGLAREQLYNSLSEGGNPTLKTFIALLKAFGLTAQFTPRAPEAHI